MTREELIATGIKSDEQLQEEMIIEQIRAYKESSMQLAVAQFMERLVILGKQRVEARREFLRQVRYQELSASYNKNAKRKNNNVEFNDLVHFESDFDDMLQANFHPFKDVLA